MAARGRAKSGRARWIKERVEEVGEVGGDIAAAGAAPVAQPQSDGSLPSSAPGRRSRDVEVSGTTRSARPTPPTPPHPTPPLCHGRQRREGLAPHLHADPDDWQPGEGAGAPAAGNSSVVPCRASLSSPLRRSPCLPPFSYPRPSSLCALHWPVTCSTRSLTATARRVSLPHICTAKQPPS